LEIPSKEVAQTFDGAVGPMEAHETPPKEKTEDKPDDKMCRGAHDQPGRRVAGGKRIHKYTTPGYLDW